MHKICFDTDETGLADGSAFAELRNEHGIEIDKFEEDTLSNKILLDREEADLIANSSKRNFLEDLLQWSRLRHWDHLKKRYMWK